MGLPCVKGVGQTIRGENASGAALRTRFICPEASTVSRVAVQLPRGCGSMRRFSSRWAMLSLSVASLYWPDRVVIAESVRLQVAEDRWELMKGCDDTVLRWAAYYLVLPPPSRRMRALFFLVVAKSGRLALLVICPLDVSPNAFRLHVPPTDLGLAKNPIRGSSSVLVIETVFGLLRPTGHQPFCAVLAV